MKKLLHERLREPDNRNRCTGRMFAEIIGCEEPVCIGAYCGDCVADLLEDFADEIERYYIPRPRFEDGEPIGLENAPYLVEYIAYFTDGSGYCLVDHDMEDDHDFQAIDEPVKRPQPKVLDADSVEIKVGENRYVIRTGEYVAVNRVNDDYCLCTVLGDDCTLGTCGYKPTELSTKEPDSLEKLRDDMDSKYADNGIICLGQFIDRLSALIERGA